MLQSDSNRIKTVKKSSNNYTAYDQKENQPFIKERYSKVKIGDLKSQFLNKITQMRENSVKRTFQSYSKSPLQAVKQQNRAVEDVSKQLYFGNEQSDKKKCIFDSKSAQIQLFESQAVEIEQCDQHGKNRDVCCVTCFEKVCSNCALFGDHKVRN